MQSLRCNDVEGNRAAGNTGGPDLGDPTSAHRRGANRIIAGRAIPHPVGDPALPADEERVFRRMLVSRALDTLTTEVQDQLVLPLEGQ